MTSTATARATVELGFDGPSAGNPFLDVTLRAVFTSGDQDQMNPFACESSGEGFADA